MGLDDLEKKLLRTPLDPIVTFTDDSNRLIRTIRFAHRFGFKMDPSIIEASKNKQIRVNSSIN
jgi:tRNA nucleotidyltransferase/poly(A) polymerase